MQNVNGYSAPNKGFNPIDYAKKILKTSTKVVKESPKKEHLKMPKPLEKDIFQKTPKITSNPLFPKGAMLSESGGGCN